VEIAHLENMTGGWFVGDFSPTALRCGAAEVGVKHYSPGSTEPEHWHERATEVTLVLDGTAVFNGTEVPAGSIVTVHPGERVRFETRTAVTTVVFKTPSVPEDKFLVEVDEKE